MTPEEWDKVNELFNTALDLAPGDREAYLKGACDGNEHLLSEIRSLLAAEDEAGDFIRKPLLPGLQDLSHPDRESHLIGKTIGNFLVEKSIGSGGMGDVFLATDLRLGRKVALKMLPNTLASDPSFLKRFENEAKAAATLNHPNVATIYSVEEIDGKQVIAMEYVEGKTLDQLTPSKGLDIATFLDWFTCLSDALKHAHERGIIHRDVKPGNIIITPAGIPKILDFGLAQFDRTRYVMGSDETSITQPGQIIGTPSYMSPEQAEGKEVDHRTDIFSLGVVMYEALTGRRPFLGATQSNVVEAVIEGKFESIAKHRSAVPHVLGKMVERCLETSRRKRLQSMREIHTILKDVRSASDAGVSIDSFARRFYLEATSPSMNWVFGAAGLVAILTFAGWYFISRPATPPFSVDRISIRKISQTSNVAVASISPDGRSIAYVAYEENGDRSLWLRRVNDPNAIQIVPPQQVFFWDSPVFSSDGEYIFYLTAERGATHGTMFRVPSLGGLPRKIVERVNHLGNLSADDRTILFVRYGDPDPNRSANTTDARIMSADALNGSGEMEYRRTEGETILRDPRFSPDGRSIIHVMRELVDGVEFWSVMTHDIAEVSDRTVLRQRGRIGEIAILHSAKGLIMNAVDEDSNRRQLFHVALTGGEITRITNDISSYMNVSVDRDGRFIVGAQRNDEGRIWIGRMDDPSSMTLMNRDTIGHQVVDWTPDGRIVFDVHLDSRLSIWISDADGKNALQLTPSDSDNSEPRVSGDGRFIAFTSNRSGFNQVWRMNIDGGSPRLLADVPGITQLPRFAADGRSVVFRWFNMGSPPLGKALIDGGSIEGIENLPPAVIYYWAMSPDGRSTGHSLDDRKDGRMKVVVRSEGAAERILDIFPSRIFKWTPGSRQIIYQERLNGENLTTKLFQIDPSDPVRRLLLSTEPEDLLDFSLAPDGERFAVVRSRTVSNAVMLTAVTETENSK